MDKEAKSDDKIFAQKIRTVTPAEIDLVSGGDGLYENQFSGMKSSGWPDNQSKNET